ncbi:AAA family ATPase [Flectobacillus longus]|uniref:AAA family ATPase n=1 Tax=Flectobacillus longus TaxID=2984207 RepID=UPI0024B6632F|nr:AAA family ATPase [Flectobacillus longus]MDI9880031.1 AAA family ATPase [Flectobacillus longus]
MFLKNIKFCRFKGQKYEWSMEGKSDGQPVSFQKINLIVGKNATGKSKTINVIRQLSDLLSGDVKLSQLMYNTSSYDLLFDDNGKEVSYVLEFEEGKVKQEVLQINGVSKLQRNSQTGTMFYEKANTDLEFQMEEDKLAVSRVDNIQQPFFEPLQNWGKSLNHYRFGGQLGKNSLLRDKNAIKEDKEVDLKDSDDVTEIFIKGENQFGEEFIKRIIDDMSKIAYHISTISVDILKFFPLPAFGIGVKESDIEDITDQKEMSQGMFRALSLLVQLNFSLLSKTPSCILIDDIGEGLDYERSKTLIDLIIEKVKGSSVQVIMTTNDRFVMNNIPLEYWSVIHRVPKKSLFYNYQNSKDIFDDFKYSGLSNFDFLRTEFYTIGFESEENIAEK